MSFVEPIIPVALPSNVYASFLAAVDAKALSELVILLEAVIFVMLSGCVGVGHGVWGASPGCPEICNTDRALQLIIIKSRGCNTVVISTGVIVITRRSYNITLVYWVTVPNTRDIQILEYTS
jgi:hypothetical protein